MYDRPTLTELIDAARMHLENQVAPAVRHDHKLYFQTLVAINVLRIAERELQLGAGHAEAEWSRLNELLGESLPLPAPIDAIHAGITQRRVALCTDIRRGQYDSDAQRRALFEHVRATTIAQLEVANPRFLAVLAQEDADPSLDAWAGRQWRA